MKWFNNLTRSLRQALAELSPSCRAAARLQSAALDRPLSKRERLGLRIHLALCKWCRRYGQHLGFLRQAAQKQNNFDSLLPPQSLRPDARERMKQQLRSAAELSGPEAQPKADPKKS